jgi:hypothetical protein
MKIMGWLLATLAASFMAWAGVVWDASRESLQYLQEIQRQVGMQGGRLEEISRQVNANEQAIRAHGLLPVHPGAAEDIGRLKAQMEALQDRRPDVRNR